MKQDKVLIIEDEPDILELVTYNLQREGFAVSSADNGEEGLLRAKREGPKLILLDLMLPGMDGIEVCRRLRQNPVTSGISVIMLTAKGEESDVILGLGMGADDYVAKPFSPKVLLARIKAVLRRGKINDEAEPGDILSRGVLVIDLARHEARLEDEVLTLTPTEFKLLHFLAQHPGRVFPRDHIVSRVIGDDAIVLSRNVDVHIRSLRKKLGEHRELIETVRGVGYRFQDRFQDRRG